MPTVRVEVLEQDIRDGQQTSQTSCPIALAVNRTFLIGRGEINVVRDAVYIAIGGLFAMYRLPLPWEARTFMDDFDRFGRSSPRAVPFAFDLELPLSFIIPARMPTNPED